MQTFSISNSFSIHAKCVTVLPRDIKLMLKTHEALQPMGIPVYESAVRAKLVNQDVENPEWRYEGQPGYVQRNTNFSPEKREKEWKHVSLRKVYIPDSNKFTDAHLQYLRDRVAIVEAEKAAAMEEAGRQFADDDAAKEAAFEAIEKRYETCLGRRQEEIEAVKKVLDRRKQAKEAKAAKRG